MYTLDDTLLLPPSSYAAIVAGVTLLGAALYQLGSATLNGQARTYYLGRSTTRREHLIRALILISACGILIYAGAYGIGWHHKVMAAFDDRRTLTWAWPDGPPPESIVIVCAVLVGMSIFTVYSSLPHVRFGDRTFGAKLPLLATVGMVGVLCDLLFTTGASIPGSRLIFPAIGEVLAWVATATATTKVLTMAWDEARKLRSNYRQLRSGRKHGVEPPSNTS